MTAQRPRRWLAGCIRRCERPDEVGELSPRHSSQSAWHRAARPATTRDLVIDIEWSTTGGPTPQTFLIHDSGRFTNQRIIMYATEEGLRLLARSGTWYMDGTFSTAPDCFRQLYVIRAEIGTTCASCVYAFFPGNTETVYTEMLEAVIAKFTALGFNTDPTVVITDFECAATSAVEIVLGGHVHKQGCSFHLTQCTWHKIQELGLVRLYREDLDPPLEPPGWDG